MFTLSMNATSFDASLSSATVATDNLHPMFLNVLSICPSIDTGTELKFLILVRTTEYCATSLSVIKRSLGCLARPAIGWWSSTNATVPFI